MIEIGAFALTNPWILLALPLLAALWWILRVTPPAPRTVRFPAIQLLLGLAEREETPARAPVWLVALRMLAAALLIFALAHPVLNPGARLPGTGALVLVVDDGWAAARNWPERKAEIRRTLDRADREGRPVVVVTTAPAEGGGVPPPSGLLSVTEARERLGVLVPKPWPVDRAAARAGLDSLRLDGPAGVVWLSNGLEDEAATAFAERLQRIGPVRVLADSLPELPLVLLPPDPRNTRLAVELRRAPAAGAREVGLLARAGDGRVLLRTTARFAPGAARASATLDLPIELRNDLARIEIEGEPTAAAVVLLDNRWQRHSVGVVTERPLDAAPALLSDLYYIEKALAPFSEMRRGSVETLVAGDVSTIIVPDSQPLDAATRRTLDDWIRRGGTVLRFAGPRLARGGEDRLTPVVLRRGGRTLGGALMWNEPARLAPFDERSPFFGLRIPKDVTITQQVLAEPSLELTGRTWARLTDGTPLVTAERRGLGWLVLVHTTASTAWTNLPLSGLFVEMLRRIVMLSGRIAGSAGIRPLPPIELIDGFGRPVEPGPSATPIAAEALTTTPVGPAHPPGYYGSEEMRRAVNLSPRLVSPEPLGPLPQGVARRDYEGESELDLKSWMLAAALLLLLIDTVATLWLRGLVMARGRASLGAIFLVAALPLGAPSPARADPPLDPEAFALEASLRTRLAYVRTGIDELDELSRLGLAGLSAVVTRRTAAELAPPMGVDIEHDELAFFPLLYWPVDPRQRPPSAEAIRRLNRYMENGGTILFDTRDGNLGGARANAAARTLRSLTRGLAVPQLTPVPPDHVLTKSFYLMQEFPGRWTGGRVWVERPGQRVNDGVSRIIIGSHDWAAAWATDAAGRSLYAVVPGGEKQREAAYRFGINLVMYALTGNYKADQVHVPAILERLGQ